MKDFRPIWKDLASQKKITARNHIENCILRAMHAKDVDKVALAKLLLAKAFTPITRQVKLENGRKPFSGMFTNSPLYRGRDFLVKYDAKILGQPWKTILSDVEWEEYISIVECCLGSDAHRNFRGDYKTVTFDKNYVFIFVRQDISPEYQLVQASHAALKLGSRLGKKIWPGTEMPDFTKIDELYFTVIGVPTLKDFVQVQKDLNGTIKYECFYESDIGGEMTAIATYPIPYKKRGKLLKYKLLTFQQKES